MQEDYSKEFDMKVKLEKALQALKTGIVVKRYSDIGGYNVFAGSDLSIVYYHDEYQLVVRGRGGEILVKDYGDVWTLRPEDLYDYKEEQDQLFEDLFLENFQ